MKYMHMHTGLADILPGLVTLRRDLHAHPELAFTEHRTAGIVARALREMGLEVHEGLGGTGVIGVLRQINHYILIDIGQRVGIRF